MKFPHYIQYDVNDCAPTCIRMICAYYKHKISLETVRKRCDINREGVTVRNVVKALESLFFVAKAVRISLENLMSGFVPLPAILYWDKKHFVVLYKIKKKRKGVFFYLSNPSYGKEVLSADEFKTKFCCNSDAGIAILIDPKQEFYIQRKKNEISEFSFLKNIKKIFARYKKKVFVSFVFTILAMVINWVIPLLFQYIIDKGINEKKIHIIFIISIAQIVLFISYSFANYISNLFSAQSRFEIGVDLMNKYIHKLSRLPMAFFDIKINSDLIQLAEDQERVKYFVTTSLPSIVLSVFNWFVFSFILLKYNLYIFIAALILSVLSTGWYYIFLAKQRKLEYKKFSIESERKSQFYELINGMSEVKLNNAQEKKTKELEVCIRKNNLIDLRQLNLNFSINTGLSFLNKLKDILIILLCAWLIIHERMTIGEMMTITYLLGQVTSPLLQILQFSSTTQLTRISMERLYDIEKIPNENSVCKQKMPTQVQAGIKLDNISFKYAGDYPHVLCGISCLIPKGKVTAIVGESGSGKTTFLKMLIGFYYPQVGDILLDDIPLNELDTEEWRKHCGIVMQNGSLFSGTILDNIALSDVNPSLEKAKEAACIACIDEFIDTLPSGYYTNLGNMGIELSGGQKQRLLIARAVYKQPQYIFLDEATSFLDVNNERKIMENLNSFFVGKTVVIIAHRLSTVKYADNILFLKNGRLSEQGTHENLIDRQGDYYKLVKEQII